MTTKSAPDQEQHLEAAIWLAHATTAPTTPAGGPSVPPRTTAHTAARDQGALIVGEFLFSSTAHRSLTESACQELRGFLHATGATVLVVARPETIAAGSGDYDRRTHELAGVPVRLVFTDEAVQAHRYEDARSDRRAA